MRPDMCRSERWTIRKLAAGRQPRNRESLFVDVQVEHLVAGDAAEQARNARGGELLAIAVRQVDARRVVRFECAAALRSAA